MDTNELLALSSKHSQTTARLLGSPLGNGTSSSTPSNGWQFGTAPSATASTGSLTSRINDLFFNPDYKYVSVSRDVIAGREHLSVYKSGASTRVSPGTDQRVKNMEDSMANVYQRMTYADNHVNQVDTRITRICEDGNNLHGRVVTLTDEVGTVHSKVVDQEKQMVRMQAHFDAQLKDVRKQHKKEINSLHDRIQRLEMIVAQNVAL